MQRFERFIKKLVNERYGSMYALAHAIGMSPSAFNRGCSGGTLSVENLLMLADHAGVPPGDVLRFAGRQELAAVVDRLVARIPGATLSALDWRLLDQPISVKQRLVALLEAIEAR